MSQIYILFQILKAFIDLFNRFAVKKLINTVEKKNLKYALDSFEFFSESVLF
jgi:hypothetical protein